MTLDELMAASRERELTPEEQSKVVKLASQQRHYWREREAIRARRRRPLGKAAVARMKARDEAGRFRPQCLSIAERDERVVPTDGRGA